MAGSKPGLGHFRVDMGTLNLVGPAPLYQERTCVSGQAGPERRTSEAYSSVGCKNSASILHLGSTFPLPLPVLKRNLDALSCQQVCQWSGLQGHYLSDGDTIMAGFSASA